MTNPNTGATSSTATTTLSDQELRAVAYFAMGVGSESAIGGLNVAYDLRFAGNINSETRIMVPVGNSGYSLGTIQTDLGQHPDKAPGLVDAYQAWAQNNSTDRPAWELTEQQRTQVIADLQRTGNNIKGANRESNSDNGVDIDATTKSRLNTFLASDAGITYTHSRDVEQIDYLMRKTTPPEKQSALEGLQGTTLYQNATTDDQIKLATMLVKLENQSGKLHYPVIINNIKDGEVSTVDEVKTAIKAVGPSYVDTGIDHALKGADAFIALKSSSDQSPLHRAWQNVVADPLVNPTLLKPAPETLPNLPPRLPTPGADNQSQTVNPIWQPAWQPDATVGPPMRLMPYETNPNIAAEYTVTKNLFLQPAEGLKFIEALDRGGAYSYGRPQQEGNNRSTAGFYVMGNDFVQWNREGVGQANIAGTWSEISRSNLTRVKNADQTVDLNIIENGVTRQLLKVDPSRPELRPVSVGPENQGLPQNSRQPAPAHGQQDQQDQHNRPDAPRNGQDPRNPQHPVQPGQQERPEQAPQIAPRRGNGGQAALGADDLNPQDKDQHEKIRIAVQKLGFEGEPASNMTAALLLKTKVEGGIKNVDEVKLNEATATHPEGTLAIATSKPYGEGRIPYFHAAVNVAEAVQIPAEKTFQNIESFNQQQSQQQALAQQQTQEKQQNQQTQGITPDLPGDPTKLGGPKQS